MRTAQFHKMFWDHETNTGVGKLHYPGFGIIGFYWHKDTPAYDINFLNKDEISMYGKQYQKETGRTFTYGCIIDRDLEIVGVQEKKYVITPDEVQATSALSVYQPNKFTPQKQEGIIYGIQALNLLLKIEEGIRYLADPEGDWLEFDDDTPHVPFEPIKSLLGLDYGKSKY